MTPALTLKCWPQEFGAGADGMKDESARRETMESVKGTIRLVQSIEAEMRR